MHVRVRFAPSPTGHVHIGNIRAAIFNWLFARHHGGSFLLRVEDTDIERCTLEAKQTLFEAMAWLRLDVDEEPLYQTSRVDAHLEIADRLVAEGKAYRYARGDEQPAVLFRMPYDADVPGLLRVLGPVELEPHSEVPVEVDVAGVRYALPTSKGKAAPAEGSLAGFRDLKLFDRDGRLLFDLGDALDAIVNSGKTCSFSGVARMTFIRREVYFNDLIKGELAKPLDGMKDLVIVRSNGTPVFHLANVCDDVHQRVTHIIRGDDHVENTYRHVLLYNALGLPAPAYAHLPMIVNEQGKPYSKRDGDAYVGDFRAKGYAPDALFNYLALLGWSPGDDREKMTRQEMIDLFALDRVKSGPAQMDIRKLTHLNGLYVNELDLDTFVDAARDAVRDCAWAMDLDFGQFRRVAKLLQSRTTRFPQAMEWNYFFTDDIDYEDKAVRKFLAKPGMAEALRSLSGRLASLESFDEAAIEVCIRDTEVECGLGAGKLNQTVRIAATGSSRGAGIYETLALLGRDRVLRRLNYAVEHLCGTA
jgi:glutamyl-tRNA synthetase